VIDKSALDGLDAPVHHVARGDTVCARSSVRNCDARDAVCGHLWIDRTVLVEDSAVPVRGVLAEADIRGDEQCWKELSQLFYGEDDGPLGIVRGCALFVLDMVV
jgi:hypothetical protein